MAYSSTWTPLRFGKHEGKTLPEIILKDPGWFYWGFGDSIFKGRLDEEAAEIARKSCAIKIPQPDPENWRVAYNFSPDWKFLDFSIIDAKTATSISSNSTISPHLDLSLPRVLKIRTNRPVGYDLIIEKLCQYYFRGSKLTRETCECFFNNDRNFLVD